MANRAQRRAQARRQARIDRIKNEITKNVKDSLMEEAIDEVQSDQVNWLLSGVVLCMHRRYGWGKDRCLRLLQDIDNLMKQVSDEELTMEELMKQVEDEVHIIVKS